MMGKQARLELLEAADVFQLIQKAPPSRTEVRIASPYITRPGLNALQQHLNRATKVMLLTKLDPRDLAFGASDPRAIEYLLKEMERRPETFQVRIMDGLHAKLLLLGKVGALGSSNLTAGGLGRNFELGVKLEDVDLTQAKRQFNKWFELMAGRALTRSAYEQAMRDVAKYPSTDPNQFGLMEVSGQFRALQGCVEACKRPRPWSQVLAAMPVGGDTAAPRFLRFLLSWGMLEGEEDGTLTATAKGREVATSAPDMVRLLVERDQDTYLLLRQCGRQLEKGMTYLEINAAYPGTGDGTSRWEVRVRWLVSLNVLEAAGTWRRRTIFRLTEEGRQVAKALAALR